MSQKMVLQHHYGHHMFGDDLAQGAKLSMRSHNRHHAQPRTGLRETVHEVVEEVEAGVAKVEERLADELHGYQRAPPGMEPQAIVKAAWGETTTEPQPLFTLTCSAAPSVMDTQEMGLRGGKQALPPPRGEACAFLASVDGEWEHHVSGDAAAAFRPTRPLDGGEHTLRVRAVDSRGYVQIVPTMVRFVVDAVDASPDHREIRSTAPGWEGAAGGVGGLLRAEAGADPATAAELSTDSGGGMGGAAHAGVESVRPPPSARQQSSPADTKQEGLAYAPRNDAAA